MSQHQPVVEFDLFEQLIVDCPAECQNDVMALVSNRRAEIVRMGKRDCFGEMALIDLFPRSASVMALSDCTAIALSPDAVHQLSERNLEQFALIQMNLGRELSRRLRVADDRLFSFRMGEPYSDSEELPPVA